VAINEEIKDPIYDYCVQRFDPDKSKNENVLHTHINHFQIRILPTPYFTINYDYYKSKRFVYCWEKKENTWIPRGLLMTDDNGLLFDLRFFLYNETIFKKKKNRFTWNVQEEKWEEYPWLSGFYYTSDLNNINALKNFSRKILKLQLKIITLLKVNF